MLIERVINNNVILSHDALGREVLIMGKGVGFQRKPGQEVPEKKIEKVFVPDSSEQIGKLAELLRSIPLEHMQVSTEIIEYAGQVMEKRLSSSIYLSLTDHINFALQREQEGIHFGNPLESEIRCFYPSEYLVGRFALDLIEKKVGVRLPEDEAASIALHFVNAEYNMGMSDTMHTTMLIREVTQLVEKELNIKLDEMGLHYSRFVTHLKFLAQRIFTGKLMDHQDNELNDMIARMYPREYAVSEKIGRYIKEQYQHTLTKEEQAYLAVHIRRIQWEEEKEET